jgi:hypothetical protein
VCVWITSSSIQATHKDITCKCIHSQGTCIKAIGAQLGSYPAADLFIHTNHIQRHNMYLHLQGTYIKAIGAQLGSYPAPHLSGSEVSAYIVQPQAIGPGKVLYPVIGKTSLSASLAKDLSVTSVSVVSTSAASLVVGSYVQVCVCMYMYA